MIAVAVAEPDERVVAERERVGRDPRRGRRRGVMTLWVLLAVTRLEATVAACHDARDFP